jgi:hypothetical protein
MSSEDFVKKYAYNIRHNYGKEGKRQEYTPFSCVRIIMGTAPAANEYHGLYFTRLRPLRAYGYMFLQVFAETAYTAL